MARITFPSSLLPKSILAAALCTVAAACLPAQEQPQDQPKDQQKTATDESWTKTSDNAPNNANPSRTTESHSKSGNRTVDKQTIQVRGPNGSYQPSSETETETTQVDASTTRTVVRTYQWSANGQKTLAHVSEEESRATAGGGTRTERKISTSDVNGNFQLVRREVADTRTVSPGVEETKHTVYQRDSYGGFSQAEQTQEVKSQIADDTVAVKRTTLMPDGNGGWKVTGITDKTIKSDGNGRTTDERISRPDINGNLSERFRTVSKERETSSGEKTSTVETYSVTAPGYNDGRLGLSQRVTTTRRKDSDGETTEQQFDEPGYGNPSDGAKPAGRTRYVVKYAAPGSQQPTQQTKTVESRDANGNFNVVSTETQKSTQPPPQPQTAPKPNSGAAPDKPQDKSQDKSHDKPQDKPQEKPPVKP